MSVIGWKLDSKDRARLLQRFPPAWPDVVADHITLDAAADRDEALPERNSGEIVGSVSDGEGVEAMVVAIDGSTDRPDGSTYHITWSIDRKRGRKLVDSNAVIAGRPWRQLDEPVPIHILPARWG
jgi:hypothetical protein